MNKKEKSILKYLQHLCGADNVTTVCMEECMELGQAISKLKRYMSSDASISDTYKKLYLNLVEEISDVLVCIEHLKILYSIKKREIKRKIKKKVKRTNKRLNVPKSKYTTFKNPI